MDNNTIKLLKIRAYTMLYNNLEKLRCEYNKQYCNREIEDTTYETLSNELKMMKAELIEYIISIADKEG